MAETITSVPDIRRITLGAADVATRINVSNLCRRVTVLFIGTDGKVASTGTDGAAISANFAPVVADQYWQMAVDQDPTERGKGPAPIYLATAAGGTTVVIISEAM